MSDKSAQNRRKLQTLLRQLFQFDAADLDFGIYRILNQKRDDIERFIERDLLDAVSSGLAQYRQRDREEVEARMAKLRQQLGAAALDADGAIKAEFRQLPIAQDYMDLWRTRRQLDLAEETEARIFNDLVTFFSRYYDDGDFLSKRRYSSQGPKYIVPYNGEEVLLHWANRDQYYVKSSERFADYRFTAVDTTVWFRLERAQTPQNDNKGESRYFVLRPEEPVVYDAEGQTLTIHFEYRPLTEEEEERLLAVYNEMQSKSNRRKTLDRGVLCLALEQSLLPLVEDPTLRAQLAAVPEGKEKSLLGRHLDRYTAHNTMDYFVHKDLSGFLRRELDFFLKNEVMRMDDVIADRSTEALKVLLSRVRVVRAIAEKIIDFLAQIEDFQKRLFEKKKFVVQTDYCLTLDRVPETFYPEIAANEAQLANWRDLYQMGQWPRDLFWNGDVDEAFLRNHPYLMLDTAFFDADFKARLLAAFDDLEAATDGLLLHSENFQALNLLQAKYDGQVKCIYIDPPYNTGEDDFVYKDNYQHSSWLTMLSNRIISSTGLLQNDGVLLVSCDDIEQHRLRVMLDMRLPSLNFMANLVWKSRQNVDSRSKDNISNDHEFVLAYGQALRGAEKDLDKYANQDGDPRGAWMSDNMVGLAIRARRPNLHFHILVGCAQRVEVVNGELILQIDEIESSVTLANVIGDVPEENDLAFACLSYDKEQFLAVGLVPTPLDQRQVFEALYECPDKGWRYDPVSMANKIVENRILWPTSPEGRPRKKTFRAELKSEFTGFSSYVGFTRDGTAELTNLFGVDVPVSFPKPSHTISVLIEQASDKNALVVDYFAGSGTTAQAVMKLNREDGGNRKYILVEMGEYFETVLKPRIKKVAFSANWKDRVPQDKDGQSHMFKYQRLESYEDALNNIRVRQPEGPQRRLLYDEFDDYILHYMLEFETKGSPALLAQEAFEKPFAYKLKIRRGHHTPRAETVDLIETFHYLIGLQVRRRERRQHQARHYHVSRGQVATATGVENVVVIWRDTEGLDLEEEADWANEALLTGLVDRVYVNGPSYIDRAEPLEITFRDRLG